MTKLTLEQVEYIKLAEKLVFTTASKDAKPRSIYVMPSRIEEDRIILSNIQMDKSLANILENNNCFLNVYLPDEDDLQIKIEGKAEVVDNGSLYEEIKAYEESENLPPELKVNSIIIVKVVSVEETNG